MTTQLKSNSTLDSVYEPVIAGLRRLLSSISMKPVMSDELLDVTGLLETLPLATDEFGLANTRLANASRYICEGELGAAVWEVRTVLNQVRSAAERKTAEPRLRMSNRR